MDIEAIEEWIGREVCGPDGEKLGKLKEVYFEGDTATVGEVKPGVLSRKRLLVPLTDATVTRDTVGVTRVLGEDASTDGLEASSDREARLAEIRDAEARAAAADAEAARRTVDLEDAEAAAARADEERRVAAARLERVRNRS